MAARKALFEPTKPLSNGQSKSVVSNLIGSGSPSFQAKQFRISFHLRTLELQGIDSGTFCPPNMIYHCAIDLLKHFCIIIHL